MVFMSLNRMTGKWRAEQSGQGGSVSPNELWRCLRDFAKLGKGTRARFGRRARADYSGATREAIDQFVSSPTILRAVWVLQLRKPQTTRSPLTMVAGATTAVPPDDAVLVRVNSAAEMHAAVMNELSDASVLLAPPQCRLSTCRTFAAKDQENSVVALVRTRADTRYPA